MKKILAIQSNTSKEINIKTDTTLLLALEGQRKGYQIIWYETKDLTLIDIEFLMRLKKIILFH